MKRLRTGFLLVATSILAASTTYADEQTWTSRSDLLDQFGWDLEGAEIKAEKLAEGFYVLFGLGGNIAVSIGDSGTLIVDDQFPELMPRIEAAIAKVGGDGVDFAINTHWHFDHADGNLAFGPAGTWLVSQDNSRAKMSTTNTVNLSVARYRQDAYPREALPVITFADRMSFHWNGERIDLLHAGPAHTTGDAAVLFRGQNAVHMGDVFNNSGYPFIDADSGGEIDGMIVFCRAVLAELAPGAKVIPGHGPVTDIPALERYVKMLEVVRGRIAKMIGDGMSVQEVIAAKPTEDFDERFGDVANSLGFVDRVYASLKTKGQH